MKSTHNKSISTIEQTSYQSKLLLRHQRHKSLTNSTPMLRHFHKRQVSNPIIVAKPQHQYKPDSLLMRNKLTKSTFSLQDAVLKKVNHSSVPLLNQKKAISKNPQYVAKKFRNFNSVNYTDDPHHSKLFQTKIDQESEVAKVFLKPSLSQRLIQQKSEKESDSKCKFKLLFREKKLPNSSLQGKFSKISFKKNNLERHRKLMQSLIPKPRKTSKHESVKPKGVIRGKQAINKLLQSLLRLLELYFNMYTHNNRVGSELRKIDGFNSRIRSILMIDETRARRIKSIDQFHQYFWIFKDDRPEFFGEEDAQLYDMLNNFTLKVEKNYDDQVSVFQSKEAHRIKAKKEELSKAIKLSQKSLPKQQKLSSIRQFIENRIRPSQNNRESSLSSLQKMGVKFNTSERAREMILRQREAAMQKFRIDDF